MPHLDDETAETEHPRSKSNYPAPYGVSLSAEDIASLKKAARAEGVGPRTFAARAVRNRVDRILSRPPSDPLEKAERPAPRATKKDYPPPYAFALSRVYREKLSEAAKLLGVGPRTFAGQAIREKVSRVLAAKDRAAS